MNQGKFNKDFIIPLTSLALKKRGGDAKNKIYFLYNPEIKFHFIFKRSSKDFA